MTKQTSSNIDILSDEDQTIIRDVSVKLSRDMARMVFERAGLVSDILNSKDFATLTLVHVVGGIMPVVLAEADKETAKYYLEWVRTEINKALDLSVKISEELHNG